MQRVGMCLSDRTALCAMHGVKGYYHVSTGSIALLYSSIKYVQISAAGH